MTRYFTQSNFADIMGVICLKTSHVNTWAEVIYSTAARLVWHVVCHLMSRH